MPNLTCPHLNQLSLPLLWSLLLSLGDTAVAEENMDTALGYEEDSESGGSACSGSCAIFLVVIGPSSLLLTWCVGAMLLSSYFKKQDFERACEDAQMEVIADTLHDFNEDRPVVNFAMGEFTATYKVADTTLTSHGTLMVDDIEKDSGSANDETDKRCKSISGQGTCEDGSYCIRDGMVSVGSGKAYWIEQETGGHNKSLIQGVFVRVNQRLRFLGRFQFSHGGTGEFTRFEVDSLDEEKEMLKGWAVDGSARTAATVPDDSSSFRPSSRVEFDIPAQDRPPVDFDV